MRRESIRCRTSRACARRGAVSSVQRGSPSSDRRGSPTPPKRPTVRSPRRTAGAPLGRLSGGGNPASFTLVEMLVVLAIIGILAAVLLPALNAARIRAQNATIAKEISDLETAIEAYKLKHNDYFPDFSSVEAVRAHLVTAFPRCNADKVVLWLTSAPSPGEPDPRKLDQAEALVFWLTMLKNNPRDPVLGSGEPVEEIQLNVENLADFDNDGWNEYVPRHAAGAPLVYLDGRVLNGKYLYWQTRYSFASGGVAAPYRHYDDTVDKKLFLIDRGRDSGKTYPQPQTARPDPYPIPPLPNDTQWVNPGKFQIICAGRDYHFGSSLKSDPNFPNDPLFKTFPSPLPDYLAPEDTDNLANFIGEGRTIGDSVP